MLGEGAFANQGVRLRSPDSHFGDHNQLIRQAQHDMFLFCFVLFCSKFQDIDMTYLFIYLITHILFFKKMNKIRYAVKHIFEMTF